MNAMPSSPTAGCGSTISAIAATGSQIAAASAENSHTNVAPPPAVLASDVPGGVGERCEDDEGEGGGGH